MSDDGLLLGVWTAGIEEMVCYGWVKDRAALSRSCTRLSIVVLRDQGCVIGTYGLRFGGSKPKQ